MILEYERVRGDVISPTRSNPSDAGLDVYFCPDDGEVKGINVHPGESVLLQTGLKVGVPHGFMLEVKNRSGVAAKKNLIVGACVIDPGYDGEIFVNLHNIGTESAFLGRNAKIAQLVLIPVVHFRIRENVVHDRLYNESIAISNRGDGALGSTGG
jgi:dUTP pyrophosphatase